jgi:hypothetical protein
MMRSYLHNSSIRIVHQGTWWYNEPVVELLMVKGWIAAAILNSENCKYSDHFLCDYS